jgi:AcrR family transcriptional regulator
MKERGEHKKSKIRETILNAARELFVRDGFDGVSMRRIAEKIEYSPAAIYLHFADKEELFRELCYRDFERLSKVFQTTAISTDLIERLRQIGRAYVEFGIRNPNHYRFMFIVPHPRRRADHCDHSVHGNPEKDAYALLKLAVQQAIDAGCLREELHDAELISETLWASAHGVISLEVAKGADNWVQWRPIATRIEIMLDLALSGLVRIPKKEQLRGAEDLHLSASASQHLPE